MKRTIDLKFRIALGACSAFAGLLCTACSSTPNVVIPASPQTTAEVKVSNPDIQNNPNVPAFVKNGGLERLHQQMLDHARAMQAAQHKQN